MRKSNLPFIPDFYDTYINKVGDTLDLANALEQFGGTYLAAESKFLIALGDQAYAPGKWTVKEVLQHMIDTERIFAYRALRFARNDQTVLPGMDQDLFAANTLANKREVEDLLHEFAVVRESTILLYRSFDDKMLLREGICSEKRTTVLALGFTIVGHVLHHKHILKERYYPMWESK